MSVREEKRVSTRSALEQSAWLLAASRPRSDITVDDISAGAGVARRTFFDYFESEEELLEALGEMRPGEFLAAVRARPLDEDPWQMSRTAMLGQLAGSPRESIDRMRAMWREPALPGQNVAGRRLLEHNLITEIPRRRPALDDAGALLSASVFLTAARVALQTWVNDGETDALTDVRAATVDAVYVTAGAVLASGGPA